MKRTTKLVSFVLCLCIIFSAVVPAVSADQGDDEAAKLEAKGIRITSFLNTLVNDVILGTLGKIIPRMAFVTKDSDEFDTENFLAGDDEFLPVSAAGDAWSVGYGDASILPDDFGTPLKYARGSYAPWGYSTDVYKDDDGNPETMKVRTIVLNDGTGRGLTVISSVDCIGISNVDVKKIRAGMADLVKDKNIISLNVSSIHSHQAIDSQGVWNGPLSTVAHNFLSLLGIVKPRSGVNADYLQTIIDRTRASVETAIADMKPGRLTYTNVELEDYMGARDVSPDVDGNMHRLVFYPFDGSRSTYIASFGAHPEVTSYGAEFSGDLSADFVYYMEKLVNSAGSNFIFVQGNVGTNSCGRSKSNDGLDLPDNHASAMRYGYEMGYICLGASMTTEERAELNDRLGDKLGVKEYANNDNYTVWYDGLAVNEEKDVEPLLNVKHKQVKLEIDNGTALVLLKLGLASNAIAYNRKLHTYFTTTEVGYLEFGSALKMFLSPGELYSELVVGGYGLRYSDYKSLRESYGENAIVCDLMNDAAGYVCPDETYAAIGYKYNPASGELESDTWCLAVSIGEHAASSLMKAYAELVEESAISAR